MLFLVIGRKLPIKLIGPFSTAKQARDYGITHLETRNWVIARATLPMYMQGSISTDTTAEQKDNFRTHINPPKGRDR